MRGGEALGPDSIVTAWAFRVRPGSEADFEAAYGDDGGWVRLFRRAPGYQGTELLLEARGDGRYLVLDYWASRGDRQRFLQAHRKEYDALDRQGAKWALEETDLGEFARVRSARPSRSAQP